MSVQHSKIRGVIFLGVENFYIKINWNLIFDIYEFSAYERISSNELRL